MFRTSSVQHLQRSHRQNTGSVHQGLYAASFHSNQRCASPESELIPSATLELIQLEGKKTGLILNPCTSLETVKDMLPITDYVMIMAVNPGFAGREFMPYTRQKFIELDNYRKEKGLNYHLMLDGGATREVIADLYHNCNVEGFVLGKQELFFQQDDYATCIDRIRTF